MRSASCPVLTVRRVGTTCRRSRRRPEGAHPGRATHRGSAREAAARSGSATTASNIETSGHNARTSSSIRPVTNSVTMPCARAALSAAATSGTGRPLMPLCHQNHIRAPGNKLVWENRIQWLTPVGYAWRWSPPDPRACRVVKVPLPRRARRAREAARGLIRC